MGLPRGLKKFVKDSSKVKLGKHGGFKAYKAVDSGRLFTGITKRLQEQLFSNGYIDYHQNASERKTRPGWKGNSFTRGRAVDAQVSRLASASKSKQKAATLIYSRHVFSALERAGLEPVMGQRGVCDEALGLATACDLVCYSEKDKQLVCVELKSGFHGDRKLAAHDKGKPCMMAKPCMKAQDTTLNRHLAQLAATHSMLNNEPGVHASLAKFGVESIAGALLYVDDSATELHPLPVWWAKRGAAILKAIAK